MKTKHLLPCIGMFFLTSAATAHGGNSISDAIWRSTTEQSPWVDKGTLPITSWNGGQSSLIEITPSTRYQQIDGWGGCFNELGWDAMSVLTEKERDSIIASLFDSTTGCGFTMARMPIGSSDYSMNFYSCDDVSGDYSMDKFSLSRDSIRMIPYINAAMKYCPSLKIWGSPWSPPGWLKDNNNSVGGHFKQDAQSLSAYALYFEKWVRAYQLIGINIFAINVQNEPALATNYSSCQWSGQQLGNFVKNYLGPHFKNNSVPADIYMGTFNVSDYNNDISPTLGDEKTRSYLKGVGLQWGSRNMAAQVLSTFPDMKSMQTEHECGNFNWMGGYNDNTAPNDWAYGMYSHYLLAEWMRQGVQSYFLWNMVLDKDGKSCVGWPQCSPISIDKNAKTIRYNPQYYAVKHFSVYVKPGAVRIAVSSTIEKGNNVNLGEQYSAIPAFDCSAFLNTDGKIALIVRNSLSQNKSANVKIGQKMISVNVPANSMNTFIIPFNQSTTSLDPYTTIRAEAFDAQKGTQLETCSEGGQDVGWLKNGAYIYFANVDFSEGANRFVTRVATERKGARIELHLDSLSGTTVGICPVPPTGGWQAWKNDTCAVANCSGTRALYVVCKGDTGYLFNIQSFQFTQAPVGINSTRNHDVVATYRQKIQLVFANSKQVDILVDNNTPIQTIRIFNALGCEIKGVAITHQGAAGYRVTVPQVLGRSVYIIKTCTASSSSYQKIFVK